MTDVNNLIKVQFNQFKQFKQFICVFYIFPFVLVFMYS